MYTLEIFAATPEIASFYTQRANYTSDAGVDLFVPEDTIISPRSVHFVSHKLKCRMLDSTGKLVAYYLYPRSSISKTPLMLANSVGIVDSMYRGDIIGAFRNLGDKEYVISKGTRLVQICAPNLESVQIKLVDSLDTNTERGEGGFGSTN